jgi:ATP-binding cassette, subfamily B, bacterial
MSALADLAAADDDANGSSSRIGPQDAKHMRSLVASLVDAARVAPSLSRGFGLTIVFATVGAMGALVVPLLLQRLVDGQLLSEGGVDVAGATRLALGAVLIALVAGLASWQAMFRLVRSSADGLTELRARVFEQLHRLPTLTVANERRGALVARVTSDVETVTQFVEWGGIAMLVGGSQLTVVAVLMLVFDPLLAAVVLGAASVYALAILGFQRLLARRYDRVRVRVANSLSAIGEAISGLPTVRAYGVEARTAANVEASLESQFRSESRVRILGAALFATSEIFAASMTALVVIVGVRTADVTGVTAGQLVAFLLLVTLFVAPIQILVEVLDQAQSAAAGLRRVLAVLDTPRVEEPAAPRSPRPGPLDLRVRGLKYRYPEGPPVLIDVDVDVAAGERIAIVGRTGSGKSTFVKVISRLQLPPDGAIGLGGVPLESIATRELRRRVAFVPQDPFLLDTSVLENVRYGEPDADDARVLRAFDELDLSDWLATLQHGPATRVGERGTRLSAGERQLVALARAWIVQPDLLVLDEATSAVDPALDVRLRRAVERMTSGRTSLTVAHRLATAEAADRILVFADGRLAEIGTHAELLAAEGVYARLHARWTVDTTVGGAFED